jgi:hypothetical protein
MDQLVNRWKSSLNSAKKSLGNSGVHSGGSQPYRSTSQQNQNSDKKNSNHGKQRDQSPSSSEDDEYYDKKKFIASLKRDINLSNSKSSSSLNKVERVGSPRQHYTSDNTDTLVTSGSKIRDHGSDKKPPRGKKSLGMVLDENTYKIMDIFKYNVDLPNQEKFLRIRKLLEDLVESQGGATRVDDLEEQQQQSAKMRHDSMRMNLLSRPDTSTKIISELESRLLESEREKIAHRNEKEVLKDKCVMLEKEVKTRSVNEDLVDMLKSNHELLEKNNEALLREIENWNKRYQEQQLIWETEVNELARTIDVLKSQLTRSDS